MRALVYDKPESYAIKEVPDPVYAKVKEPSKAKKEPGGKE